MGFFSQLFQFQEGPYPQTHQALLNIAEFTSDTTNGYFRERCDFRLSNGAAVSAGMFSTPSVSELRDCLRIRLSDMKKLKRGGDVFLVNNIIGEARSLHRKEEFKGAIVQAASQFNFLEFISDHVTPEKGIGGYAYDRTQGPAVSCHLQSFQGTLQVLLVSLSTLSLSLEYQCLLFLEYKCAMACAAGAAYRNYLVPVPFETTMTRGQTKDRQLNGLEDVEKYIVENNVLKQVPWKVKNGYIRSTETELNTLNQLLEDSPQIQEDILARLRIGIQEDTAVTDALACCESDDEIASTVTQTYNSAISIGYCYLKDNAWEPIARIILDATYEATLLVGLLKTVEARIAGKAKDPVVLLTKVGGGVFGNDDVWIEAAMSRAIQSVQQFGVGMDIRIVHFREIDSNYRGLERFSGSLTNVGS